MEPTRPAVLIWVQPQALIKMADGIEPNSWYLHKPDPNMTSTDYVQALVPYTTFIQLWDKQQELERQNDLPF
jgi:hypothetical protein